MGGEAKIKVAGRAIRRVRRKLELEEIDRRERERFKWEHFVPGIVFLCFLIWITIILLLKVVQG